MEPDDKELMAATGGVDPDGSGPLDCRGRGCSTECEKRHLDPVEQSRWSRDTGFRYPRKPSVVVTASRDMGGTASTWVFNAVRLLFRQAREACDSYWMRQLAREEIERRLSTGAHVLVKTHEWTDHISREDFKEILPMFTHVVVSVREGRPPDPAWMEVATHITHFEEIVEYDESLGKIGALSVLRDLAGHLGIAGLTDSDFRAVDYELMTLPIPGNQTTKFWSFHGRRGGRPRPKAPPDTDTK